MGSICEAVSFRTSLNPYTHNPNNLAYVIYTSGSTGKPKGVAIAHSSLVNFAQATVQEYEITQSDRILQFASISFDASVEEIYPCLIAGGTLVLRSEEMGYSPSLLLKKSRDYGITILDLPTAFWHLLTAELEQNPQLQLPESIRLVIIGGEVVNPDKVASWNRLVGTSCQLINTYGPTEATVVATSYKIPHQIDNLATIPIGKPLPNLQTYILDKNLQPVAIGVPGELYIGGVGVARGYLNRPELTKEKFLEVKSNNHPPLYKTGDKARYLPNGNIEFLGRIDNQVGATGFLGAFLLAELLQQTEANIYCLVRADNLVEGKQKIEQSLVNYLLWENTFDSRIIPVLGDLSQPFLGLSDAKFQSLAAASNLIYHNGAGVHHAMPYSTLKAANVLGTKEVLRLASTEKIKPVHFISTISVFSGVNNSGSQVISEIAKIDDFAAPEGGYVQSKWVADKLVNLAGDRGLPVTIYRPGGISGDSTTGVFNSNDFLYRLLIGCIELGAIPQGDFLDSLMPVDYVSQAIVKISLQPESLGKAFHLVNRDRLDFNILTNLIRAFGYELQELNQDQWQAKLTAIAENQPEHPLYPLISLLSSDKDSGNAPPLQFDCQNTLQALAKTEISCPAMDEKLLRTYLSYLHNNGFLKNICKVGNAHPTLRL